MYSLVFWQEKSRLLRRHFRFYLSRMIGYPLVEPDMLQLCFSFRCNLKCKMCNIQEKYEKLRYSGQDCELSFETIIDLIGQASDMGIKQLFLLGGEPFLREDLFDIIKFAHSHKMKTLVFTNGTLLGNDEIIDRILESRLEELTISIDGACENTYKNIRSEEVLGKIKSNVRLLNKIKKERSSDSPNINIFCTIMNQNIEELTDITYLAKELEAVCLGFQPVVIDNTDARMRNSLDPNWIPESRYAALDRAIDKLIEFKLSNIGNFNFILANLIQLRQIKQYFRGTLGKQKCYVGFNRIIISQDGKMYFCAEEPDKGEISFGDIRKERLRDLWYSRRARIFRKSIKRCDKPCLLCCAHRDEFDRFIDTLYWDFLQFRN